MKQLIFTLGLFASTLILPSTPTPHASQAVGLDADQKTGAAHAAATTTPADVKTRSAQTASSATKNALQNLQKLDDPTRTMDFFFSELLESPKNPDKVIKHALGLTKMQIDKPLKCFDNLPMIIFFSLVADTEVVKSLIVNGANVNIECQYKKYGDGAPLENITPLEATALSKSSSKYECMRHLLLAEANPDIKISILIPLTKTHIGITRMPLFDGLWHNPLVFQSIMCALIELSKQDMPTKLDQLKSLKAYTPKQEIICKMGLENRAKRNQHLGFIQNLQNNSGSHVLHPPLFKIIFAYAGRPIMYSLEAQVS